jgi:hypothetical protein
MLSSEARRVLTAVVAFAGGIALASVPLGSGPLPFRETSRFPVWVFLVAIACASCPVVWSRGISALAQLPARRPLRLEMLAYAACAVVLTVGVLLAPTLLPSHRSAVVLLPYLGARFTVVYVAAALAAAPGTIAMYRIWGACLHDEARLPDLVAWRAILQDQLAALGTLIALATLATAALRDAILAAFSARPDDFPAEYVLLFGAVLTGVVALAYVPPSEQLRRRARTLVEDVLPVPSQLDGDWQKQLQQRHDLASLLRIDETSRGAIQNAVIIGGPLITSALTLLIPTS